MGDLARRTFAEAAGTFVLVFAGTSAIAVDARSDGELGNLGVALVFGLAIAAGVFALRQVSGAHFNPAISVAMAAIGRFRPAEIPVYVAAQLAAAVAASLLVKAVFGGEGDLGVTRPDIELWRAFLIEATLTGILAFVIARVAAEPSLPAVQAAIAIGGAVALGALVGGPLTGGSMNPARSFGPALVALAFEDHWLYWLAPVLGATAGALLYAAIGRDEDATPPASTRA
jgi:MIP family channel proteins